MSTIFIGDYTMLLKDNPCHLTIPEGVATIIKFAFSRCTSLKTVTIPEGVIEIGDDAFEGCTRF